MAYGVHENEYRYIEVGRLRRALELDVVKEGALYRVWGGEEPHWVNLRADKSRCDCTDFLRWDGYFLGEDGAPCLCKHILRALLYEGDTVVIRMAAELLTTEEEQQGE